MSAGRGVTTAEKPPFASLTLATLLVAALLSGLISTIGVLVLLARGVLATLLSAVTLFILAALLAALVLAALILLVLILVHRCLLGMGLALRMESTFEPGSRSSSSAHAKSFCTLNNFATSVGVRVATRWGERRSRMGSHNAQRPRRSWSVVMNHTCPTE
jgi:hypothetical protein